MAARPEPQIVARFVLDKDGLPQWEEDDNGYWIRLKIENTPSDTYFVTYELHESYYDPIRVSRKPAEFTKDITSYGDYTVKARLSRKTRTDSLATLLSRALKAGHAIDQTDEIAQAIKEIANH